MPADISTNLTALFAILSGLWLLHVLKLRHKSRKPAALSMIILLVFRIAYYIAKPILGGETLVVILINLISLAGAIVLLYVFAVSLVILIVYKK